LGEEIIFSREPGAYLLVVVDLAVDGERELSVRAKERLPPDKGSTIASRSCANIALSPE
jgi:hypothetical protein